jgi:hypothetical protein
MLWRRRRRRRSSSSSNSTGTNVYSTMETVTQCSKVLEDIFRRLNSDCCITCYSSESSEGRRSSPSLFAPPRLLEVLEVVNVAEARGVFDGTCSTLGEQKRQVQPKGCSQSNGN